MALTQTEKDNVITLAKHFLGVYTLNIVERENVGASTDDLEHQVLTGQDIVDALTIENVNDILDDDQQQLMYQRLMGLLKIKTEN